MLLVKYNQFNVTTRRITYPGQSHPIGSDGNSPEVVGILGIGFRPEVVGCRKVSELRYFDRVPDHSDTFRYPTTFDKFPSDPVNSDSFSDEIQWDLTVGLLILGS